MTEILSQTPAEIRDNLQIGTIDHLSDSGVGLGDMLAKVGFEGLRPEERLALVENATIEDYMVAVDAIHRNVAPDYSHEPHPEPMKLVDRDGIVKSYTALPEERAGIMEYALSVAKQIIKKYRQEGGSIDDALQRCANLAAFGVVLAHTYENGNGRTARTLGELIHNGYDSTSAESVADLAVICAERPEKGFRINSYVPTGDWADGRANRSPVAFLDAVAALDRPLDGVSYAAAASHTFTTPRM